MIVLNDPALLPPLTWPPGGKGDCPHVLDVDHTAFWPDEQPERYYCTGEADHAGDHAAESSKGTAATWATGDDGDKVDHEAQAIIDGLAADLESAFHPQVETPRQARARRRRHRKGRK